MSQAGALEPVGVDSGGGERDGPPSTTDTIATPVPPSSGVELRREPSWGVPRGEELEAPGDPPNPPSDAVFLPVAQGALADIAAIVPGGICLAMVVINVRRAEQKTYSIEVTALDASGDLHSIEASRELRQAASRMISLDARDGNGKWRRLVATLTPSDREEWIHFDMK